MKLLASAAALATVAVFASTAGPALSLTKWRPEPVDFELAADPGAVLGRPAARGGVVSEPLRPGKRFNLVGLRWRGRTEPGVAIRTRRGGGGWTRWTTLYTHAEDGPDPGRGEAAVRGTSMPAWVGEADEVQYRLTRRVPGLRLHFVNTRGTATGADRVRTGLRRAVNAGVASAAAQFAGVARAQQARPSIVPREDWGADRCPPRAAPDQGVVKAAFIHHTVNANDYTREESPSIVLAICRFHRNSNGWNDIGYNFLVDKYGTLFEGRAGGVDRAVVGAQAQGYNAQSTGIANIGDHRSVAQTPQALAAIARLIRWKLPLHGTPTGDRTTLVSAGGGSNRYAAGRRISVPRVIGHRDLNSTTCPGEALYAQLPELRRMIGSLGPLGNGTSLSARLARRTVRAGRRVRVRGSLATSAGAPLRGERLSVQVRRGRRWRTLRRVVTDSSGSFSLLFRARVNRLVRARFGGRGELLAASSLRLRLRVRTAVALIRPPETAGAGERVRLRGTVSPRKRRLWQVLQLRRRGSWRKVGLRRLTARRGRFRGSFVPAAPGRYRYYVVARADRSNVRGRTALQELLVE